MSRPIAALLYDFDKTLSPRDMPEYGFVPGIGMTPEPFWACCEQKAKEHRMDPILAYMMVMIEQARGKLLLNRSAFQSLGRDVALFPGVVDWFSRVNAYAGRLGLVPEHYIISSGLREIIEGTPIASEFTEIYAAEFCYDDAGVPVWPAMAVNYTSKTQFLFRVNKGVLDPTDHKGLNETMPEEQRRVPFRNMIYFGDGFSDVPCMKLVREHGGHSIALYHENDDLAHDLLRSGRVDFTAQADYREGQKLEQVVFDILDHIASGSRLAHREQEEKQAYCRI